MAVSHLRAKSSERHVFLHGSPSDSSVWSKVLALAPAGTECLCIDLPDHGSAADEPTGDARALEARLAAQVAGLGANLVLVGHSYGAYLSARLAARLPGRVRRLVLVSGLAELPRARTAEFADLARRLQSGELELEALSAAVAVAWYGAGARATQHDFVATLLHRTGPARLSRLLSRLAQLSNPELAVRPHSVPARVVHSEHDATVPLEQSDQLRRLASSAELSIVPGFSHMLPLTHAATVAAAAFAA